jgi:hypothetical protein
MEVVQIDLADHRQVREFVDLPFRIYRECPQWVPPLEMDVRLVLDRRRHPFYRHSQAAFFLARQDGRPVGRIVALDNRRYNEFNHEKTAFFYWFECEENPEAARDLFAAAADWARQLSLERMIGPKGFTPLDGGGLLVQGFDHRPAFGMPYNPPYYPALVEAAGFQPHSETVSGYLGRATARFPERIHELAARVAERRGLRVVSFRSRRELRALVPGLKELYNGSLSGTRGNTPLDDEDVATLADQMLLFADPKLIKLVKKDERIVGFLFAYPDISAALQKTRGRLFPFGWATLLRELHATDWININGAGLLEEVRGLGGTAILFSEIARSLTDCPQFNHGDIVQIGVENENMQREMQNFGIDFYKRHRVYIRDL